MARRKSNEAEEAFIELCKMGCDPHILGEHFILLQSESVVQTTFTPEERIERMQQRYEEGIGPALSQPIIEFEKRRGTVESEIALRPMDSWETALGKFRIRDLENLQNKCKDIAKEIEYLHSTRLIQYGWIEEEFSDKDYVIDLAYRLNLYAEKFLPLILNKAKQIGLKKRPDYVRILSSVYNHIHERTGDWKDELVADILNDLFPNPDNPTYSGESLSQWRYRQRIVDAKDKSEK